MNIKLWLDQTRQKLIDAGVETARLDAEVLLSDVLGKNRAWLLAHPEEELQSYKVTKLQKMAERRLQHEPIAYILGHKEFYGRDFIVNSDVLVPRPESEMMLELLIKEYEARSTEYEDRLQIIDIGTGSGNLIITAALEISKVKSRKSKVSYIGLDISEDALKVARKNAKNLGANVEFKKFDLMNDDLSSILNLHPSILLCNLPYVPIKHKVNGPAKHEPKIALFSGADGLDHYRKLFKQLVTIRIGCPIIITESLLEQHQELSKIAKLAGFKQTAEKDLIQVFSRPSTL